MNKVSSNALQRALNKVLFNEYGFHGQAEKVNFIFSLCSYYNNENKDIEIGDELKKLNDNLLDYELLLKLTQNLKEIASKNFNWDPHFHREGVHPNLTLSPTFNIENINVTEIITEVGNIRAAINNRSVNLNTLISYISKRAIENGDLDKEIVNK
jgi:hypothetical protein